MSEYLLISFKTILFLLVILVIIRIMGKRELGQLNVFDIIIFFMISEIFSNAIADPKSDIFITILPIFIISFIQIIISIITLKSKKIRNIIESTPVLIIENGNINYDEMKKQRYNIDDLLQQVREEGIDDISSINYAVLESNGGLSVIKKEDTKLSHPFPIISDGKLDNNLIKKLGLTIEWIDNELNKLSISSIENVFIAFLSINRTLIVFSKETNNVNDHKNN